MAMQSNVKINRLETPLQVGLASSDHVVAIIGNSVTTICIKTNHNGNIVIRNTPVWIMDDAMDEVLLGDDLLKKLGIDVYQLLLEKGGQDIDYNDMEPIQSIPHLGGDDEEKIKSILREKLAEVDDPDFDLFQQKKWSYLSQWESMDTEK